MKSRFVCGFIDESGDAYTEFTAPHQAFRARDTTDPQEEMAPSPLFRTPAEFYMSPLLFILFFGAGTEEGGTVDK